MYGNELLRDILRRTIGLLLVGVLAGCTTDPNTTKMDESVKSKEPGRYVATTVLCTQAGREISIVTSGKTILGLPTPSAKRLVVKGPNVIAIGKGQIIDAGSLDIIPIDMSLLQGSGIEFLTSSEAPPAFKEAIKLNLPDLYPKIYYTTFSPYPRVLAQ
jgi:hypothetical protein